MATHDTHSGSQELHHEPMPVSIYIGVFVGLLILTAITVIIAGFDFGEFNLLVAMAVAVVKASLVVLYFMNLKHDHDRLNGVVFLSGVFFLAIFVGPTMYDAYTREAVDPARGRSAQTDLPVGYPAQLGFTPAAEAKPVIGPNPVPMPKAGAPAPAAAPAAGH